MGHAWRSRPLPCGVLAIVLLGCTTAGPLRGKLKPPGPTLYDVRKAASRERVETATVIVERLELGEARRGVNTLRARVTNRSIAPLSIGIDLRTIPGLWFRAWQRQYQFEIAARQTRVVEAPYELYGVTPDAILRVRVGRPRPVETGGIDVVDLVFERRYPVGRGNPAAGMTEFRELHTDHLDLYASRGSPADGEIVRIASEREDGLRRILDVLAVQPAGRIRIVLYGDAETKRRDTGHTGAGWARGNNIVEVYDQETRLDPFHELTHVLSRQMGDPPALLSEGLAVYVSERLGSGPGALDTLGHPGKGVDQAVCDLAAAGRLVPMGTLLRHEEIGSDASEPWVAYPQAASFVKHLVGAFGLERFRQAYGILVNGGGSVQAGRNEEAFVRVFDQPLDEVERGWRRSLACSSPPGH